MVRLGRRAGAFGLVLLSVVAGCNDDTPAAATSTPSAGGSATDFATLEQRVGRVLVIGESADVAHYEHEYRGSPTPDASETVSCNYTTGADGVSLRIEAGQVGASGPGVQAIFRAPSLAPAKFDVDWSASDDQNIRVRLGEGMSFQYHEYELGSDGNQLSSRCNVALTKLDANQLVGVAACRALMATSASLDASGQGGADSGPGVASVTLDFACPFKALSSSGGGAGGAANGGSGGNSTGGTGGSTSVGGSSGGIGGSGGATKHCVGVTTPCSLRSSATCEDGTGCTLDENCEGVSTSCYGQFSAYSCSDIQGCYWSSSSKNCSGSAWTCSLFSGLASCIDQPGCNWTSDCTGVAPLCSDLSEITCGLEPGCHLE